MTTFAIPIPKRPTHPTGILNWITTIDHKKIGVLYGVTAFILFLTGGIEAFLIRMQLAAPGMDFVSPEIYNQLFTMHGTTMIFLAIMPMGAAFFNFLIPLQIGARDVAFPRLNAFSYWTFLAGAIMLKSSWFLGGAPNAGWFGYAPITEIAYNPGHGIDFWILSLQVLGIASLAAAFNFIVTIINLRAPGMTLMRMPLFTWMTFITSILLVLAFPVITVALIELMFDRFYGMNFFNPLRGGNPVLWQHLFWVFGHPEVYILILPAMGLVSEIIPTFSKKPLFGYPVVVVSGIVIGFMGWMVWSHHMFTVGLGAIANSIFAITTMLIAVPTGVKIFNWIATMWKGSIDFNKTAMLYSIGFIFLFIIGGLSGVMHSSAASDAQQQDTYFIVAHIHYVLFGGALMALLAGVYFYFPKVTGKLMDENLGRMNFWLTFIGMNLTFFPMHFSGMDGMPRRIYTYTSDMGWDLWNLLSTFGVFIMGAGILIFVLNVVYSYIFGKQSGNDPWDARTIEWSISSPPPEYNFEKIPLIQSLDAFWEHKRNGTPIEPASGGSENSEEEKDIHLPQPSYWPMVVSIGIMLAAYGMIFGLPLSILGTIIGFIGVYAWSLEPVNEPTEH
ncbi:MAG: cytochrome c oxidase subunit I [Chloroflexi bacterium]|nr:cytochrome c oxidase subunit I [Chloroflexota bacterium]|tara:strand:- start:9571 stop:11415 length:1845 start_codon:yes stop_codon:yes gene_type:complete